MLAVTRIPGGAWATESPWLIHTDCSAGWPWKRVESVSTTWATVCPYSRRPVRATSPPRANAIAWNP